jgi:predicted alpha/beta-fold hydrolase
LMARKESVTYQRERLELADDDFLDLDWLRNGHRRLIVLSAGMEGDSQRHYMKRTAGYFFTRGWDVLAWNYRSCSGELNYYRLQAGRFAESLKTSKVIQIS